GGMKLDLVDPPAARVMGAQLGRVLVGEKASRPQDLADDRADASQLVLCPAAAFALERLAQWRVGGPQVVGRERRRLIVYDVGEELIGDRHRASMLDLPRRGPAFRWRRSVSDWRASARVSGPRSLESSRDPR